jgi:23S rRNA (cytidine1920-2'-O)/16S rRNA (cytidine1409-2'-O)-methyltransferase
MARRRLDAELVRRGLARSRETAAALIEAGRVSVSGAVATKAATQVDEAAAVVVREADGEDLDRYVSRGAFKLLGALAAFEPQGLEVAGRHALDAGASTGGFTQVLLERGAAGVIAVDVGYGQLAWPVRTDPRVVVLERTNVRDLAPQALPWRPGLVVGDLSFISLALVLPALVRCVEEAADLVLMVKPQFEVGRERVGPGGVVRDPRARVDAVRRITTAAAQAGYGTRDVVASPLPGPRGNVEYFVWLRTDAAAPDDALLERAVQEGPS